jgi:hypothetical protein
LLAIFLTKTSPAVIGVTGLTIEPKQARPGESLNISITVANTGGREGSYILDLKVNNQNEGTQLITLAAKASRVFVYQVSKDTPGTYTVATGGLTGQFVITGNPAAATPTTTPPPGQTTTSAAVTTTTTASSLTTAVTTTSPSTTPAGLYEWVIMDGDVSRMFAQISDVPLTVHFVSGNKAEFTISIFSGTINMGIRDGKLCGFPVPQTIIDLFPAIQDYVFYIDGAAYLPFTWFDPAVEIAADVTAMPVMVSVRTENGKAIVTYVWPPNP